jgi:Zn-dependent peptidase ImmA (M78 family)
MPGNALLATEAAGKALRLRKQLGISLEESICPMDAAEKLGVEVRLVDFPSMEGIYIAGSTPKIVISSLRPQGRRNFTCAHELGHHLFGHGQQFDELTDDRTVLRKNDPKEFLADCFAAYFLMPKATVDSGMRRRGFTYQTLEPFQAYALASWLGVGYGTLLNHLQYGIRSISADRVQSLRKLTPTDIRRQILARSSSTQLHIADPHWSGRAIDSEVGDYLLLPRNTQADGEHLLAFDRIADGRTLIRTEAPGIARITNTLLDWAAFVRISPHNFIGRSCYRFEENVDE